MSRFPTIFLSVCPQQVVEAEEYLRQMRLTFPDFCFGLEVDFSKNQAGFGVHYREGFLVAYRFPEPADEQAAASIAAIIREFPLEYAAVRGGSGLNVQESAEYARFWESRVKVLKALTVPGVEVCVENASPRRLVRKNGSWAAVATPHAGMFGRDLAALAEKVGCRTFIDTEHLIDGIVTVKEWGRSKIAVPCTAADQNCLDLFGFFIRCGKSIFPTFMSLDKGKEIKKSGAKRFRITGSSVRIGAGGQRLSSAEITGSDFQQHLFNTVLCTEPVSITVGKAEAGCLEAQKRSLEAAVKILLTKEKGD